jgi:hypothetical protein
MENEKQRIIIRIGRNTLAFAMADETAEHQMVYEPYVVSNSMSMAANLREAFRKSPLLNKGCRRALVVVETQTLLVPVREFDENRAEMLYRYTCDGSTDNSQTEQDTIVHNVLPNLNAVAVYKLNRDLQLVIGDHFTDVRYNHLMQAVWSYFHARNFATPHNKLFAYLHDKQLEVFSFDKNRFRFSNSFKVENSSNAVYFLLSVWKQLGFDAQNDEIRLVFDTAQTMTTEDQQERQQLIDTLRNYVKKVNISLTATDENIGDMPFDLKILFED